MTNKIIFAFLVAFLSSTSAFADGYFKGGFLYQSDASGSEGSQTSTNRQLMDLAAGYLDPKGWTFGLLYATDKYSSSGGSINRVGIGPSVGWMSTKDSGPFVSLAYFYNASYDPGNMTGTGFQLDVGYKFAVRRVSFGAQLSKKQITFDKVDGNAMSPKYIEDKIDPYIVMIVTF